MDLIDRQLITMLIVDCRATYRNLADQVGLTANAVKKRIDKMLETGVLAFDVALSYAMCDADPALFILEIESTSEHESIVDAVGSHPLVLVVIPMVSPHVMVLADYRGASELADLNMFFYGIEQVKDVEVHTLLTDRGKKGNLDSDQRKVLRCLLDDPRMPTAGVAKCAGITSRRASRAIQKFYDDKTVNFMARWNPNMSDSVSVTIRIDWNPNQVDMIEMNDWLKEEFSDTYWFPYTSASSPTFFALFILDHIRDAEEIDDRLKNEGIIDSSRLFVPYPGKLYPRPRRNWIEEQLNKQKPDKH